MKARLDGTRSARRRPLPLKAALVANSCLKACLRVHAKPIVTIKLTHKKPLVAEATQFRVFGGASRFVSPYDHAVNRFLTMAWRAQAQCDMRVRGSNPIATGYEWPGRLEPQSMARATA